MFLKTLQANQDKFAHPVIPLIWKLPRWPRYSCSVFPGNFDARNCTGDMVGLSVSTWCCEKYPLGNKWVGDDIGAITTHIRRRPFRFKSPLRGLSSAVRSLILHNRINYIFSFKANMYRSQRWFSGSVCANNSYPWIQPYIDIDSFEQKVFGSISEGDLGQLKQRWWYLLCLGESGSKDTNTLHWYMNTNSRT